MDNPQVILDLKAKSKLEAINELAQVLLASKIISDKEAFVQDILKREEMMSTYCGYHIAIPHSVSSVVKQASFAFGRTSGITWDEDDEEVKFILILAIPDTQDGEDSQHIEMMSEIATLALEDEVREQWEKATTIAEIIQTFKNE